MLCYINKFYEKIKDVNPLCVYCTNNDILFIDEIF